MMLGCFSQVSAQDKPGDDPAKGEQKIKALYVAYVTKELNLTESEAQKFWPVHAEFEAEMKTINDKPELPELEREQAALNIKKKYQERFSKILGASRTNDFYKTNDGFRKKLIERLRNIRQQRKKP
jgi:hypothetical protein